ncbi:ADP-ribosylglycohydrolase family protein [Chondromyces crocatus]|uniref:Crystallin n=1 Tax=Chondromyces crocatus TaxID=52 RepID=A0A0K1ENZ5_CHOCO|nr:ADP-ribosylglycohydrolase family protein [Chondromyces crocatus]AKT42561.1 crystallin [Chondromyces crocatus]
MTSGRFSPRAALRRLVVAGGMVLSVGMHRASPQPRRPSLPFGIPASDVPDQRLTLPLDHAERLARARLSLDGLSLGDAFGQQFFRLAPVTLIDARAFPEPPWDWTDDTEMALAITEVLTACGCIERDVLAWRFARRWAAAPDRGYGRGAHHLLQEIYVGGDWREVAAGLFRGEGSLGNGGAMRVAPLGAYFADDPDRIVVEARASAEVTHAHPEGQAGAIAVALGAAHAWRHRAAPNAGKGAALLRFVLERTPAGPTAAGIARAAELPPDATPATAASLLGVGEDVTSMDTVPFSLWCAARHLDDFEEALWTTVSGLGDRDTTCAIVGGIVALAAETTVPARWRAARAPLSVG